MSRIRQETRSSLKSDRLIIKCNDIFSVQLHSMSTIAIQQLKTTVTVTYCASNPGVLFKSSSLIRLVWYSMVWFNVPLDTL